METQKSGQTSSEAILREQKQIRREQFFSNRALVIGLVIFTVIVLAAVFIPMVTGAGRILWKLILPNVISPLTVQASYIFAQAIISEASLSFLGAGIAAPAASWGNSFRQAETGAFQHRYRFFNDEPPHKPAFPANNTNGK